MGVFVFLIQMGSFTCRVLLFGSLSMMFALSQSTMWLSVIARSVMTHLLKLDINLFPQLLVYFSLFVLSTSFLCSSSRVFSSLPVSPIYSAPQFLHDVWYTSSPCSVFYGLQVLATLGQCCVATTDELGGWFLLLLRHWRKRSWKVERYVSFVTQ